MRHRRTSQRRQVDALQRAHARRHRGGELSVLHDRAERRHRRGAGPAPGRARGDREAGEDDSRRSSSSSTSRGSSPARRRARGSATSSSRTSARPTRSRTSCAASRTATSCTSPARSTRCPTSRRSTPSSRSPTSRRSTSRSSKVDKLARSRRQGGEAHPRRAGQGAQKALDAGRPARSLDLDDEERALLKPFFLLTMKPTMYVANVAERGFKDNPLLDAVVAYAAKEGAPVVPVCASLEAEIADLDGDDKAAFLADLGLAEPGLDRVIHAGYKLLGLQTYFTAGPKEVRAWTIEVGATAPQAAGVIHTDFEKGFIRAETIAFDDFVRLQGRAGRQGRGQDAAGGQGLRRARRRRHALPVQRLIGLSPGVHARPATPAAVLRRDSRRPDRRHAARRSDTVPLPQARANLSGCGRGQGGAEKIITKNGESYVALIDADRLDYYHRLERERIHLVLLDEVERGLADCRGGRSREARAALARAETAPRGPDAVAARFTFPLSVGWPQRRPSASRRMSRRTSQSSNRGGERARRRRVMLTSSRDSRASSTISNGCRDWGATSSRACRTRWRRSTVLRDCERASNDSSCANTWPATT